MRAVLLLLMPWGCSGAIDNQSRTQQGGPIGVAGSGAVPGASGSTAAPPSMNTQQQDDAMRAQNPQLFDLAAMYFPGQAAAGGKPRLFRLTRAQLDRTTQALLPKSVVATAEATLPRDPLQTNYEYADNLSWNPANFAPYTGWITAIAEKVRADPKQVVDCSAQGDAPACLDMQARRFVTRAFRGVATEAQLARYARFFTDSVMAVGMPGAAADLVEVTLSSPSYVFREEVQTDARRVLLPAQLLQALSYTLADAPPEALGLTGDPAMLVGTPEALRRTVDTLLATPQARDKLLRFFLAWLEVKDPAEFTISANVFPEWTPAVAQAVVDETRKFLQQQLMGAAPALKDITQSKKAFISQASAFIYGSDARASGMLVDVDPAERVGIFTQPAVIASHSGPTNTRLVKRGVFFTRKVMCMPLGAPPPGIDTTVPTTAGMTERQRVDALTGKQPCLGCHAAINPFGFMQESYDAIGRFRTRDEERLPIDSSISVDFLVEGPLMTKTSVEALTAFTGSSRFKQCFTRQLFRFYLGRDEVPTDDPLLRQLFFNFASGDKQDIVGMLRQLAGADAFGQRTEVP